MHSQRFKSTHIRWERIQTTFEKRKSTQYILCTCINVHIHFKKFAYHNIFHTFVFAYKQFHWGRGGVCVCVSTLFVSLFTQMKQKWNMFFCDQWRASLVGQSVSYIYIRFKHYIQNSHERWDKDETEGGWGGVGVATVSLAAVRDTIAQLSCKPFLIIAREIVKQQDTLTEF